MVKFGSLCLPSQSTSQVRPGQVFAMKKLRCAIYTRKSSKDGLKQEFNSLDAQREVCAAYIASQKHEGWVLLPEDYDDGACQVDPSALAARHRSWAC